jgi:hypothetical protein
MAMSRSSDHRTQDLHRLDAEKVSISNTKAGTI